MRKPVHLCVFVCACGCNILCVCVDVCVRVSAVQCTVKCLYFVREFVAVNFLTLTFTMHCLSIKKTIQTHDFWKSVLFCDEEEI